KRIIAVTHVKVMKWYDYGYLEEIIIQREDQTLHKFKEGDFSRLNLPDIEDLLLLLVQKKVSNLEKDVIFDLNVALRMFIGRVVILKRVEDLQLGVESYHKKLNLTKPKTFRSDISKMTPYTFYDGTLTSVRNVLHDIARNLRMEYLPKRSKSENNGKVSTEMELVLEQTQQGTSHKVSVSTKGVEELKRKVKIKGDKKEALLTLRQKPGQYIYCQNHKDDC
nr:hypothetical protein [Tanacetum cinerariifolium]